MRNVIGITICASVLFASLNPQIAQASEPSLVLVESSEGSVELNVSTGASSEVVTKLSTIQDMSLVDSDTSGPALLLQNSSDGRDDIAAAMVTDQTVLMAWDFVSAGNDVKVTLDGETIYLGEAKDSFEYDFLTSEVDAVLEFSQIEPPAGDSVDEKLSHFTVISYQIENPSSAKPSDVSATFTALAAALPSTTTLRYQTFIADEFVPDPPVGCIPPNVFAWPKFYYSGNNRSFGPGNTANKTLLQVDIDWASESMSYTRYVQSTRLYGSVLNGPKVFVASLTADVADIYAALYEPIASSRAHVHLHQDIHNPFCASLGIYFDISGYVYRSGNYYLHGDFRQVPNHEFYTRDSLNAGWQVIYRADINSNFGFLCLTPGFSCIQSDSWNQNSWLWYH
jgi:hypothetical protein